MKFTWLRWLLIFLPELRGISTPSGSGWGVDRFLPPRLLRRPLLPYYIGRSSVVRGLGLTARLRKTTVGCSQPWLAQLHLSPGPLRCPPFLVTSDVFEVPSLLTRTLSLRDSHLPLMVFYGGEQPLSTAETSID